MTGKTNTARLKRLGLGAAASLGLLALSPNSFAAPIGGIADVRIPSAVTQVRGYYQCWWADGDRHCAWLNVPPAPRIYSYYRPYYFRPHYGHYRVYRRIKRPEAYWTGSERWWKSMDYWGRAGQN